MTHASPPSASAAPASAAPASAAPASASPGTAAHSAAPLPAGHGAAASASPAFAAPTGTLNPSEAAGLTAMAEALIAAGHLSRQSATQMLHAELASEDRDMHTALARAAQGGARSSAQGGARSSPQGGTRPPAQAGAHPPAPSDAPWPAQGSTPAPTHGSTPPHAPGTPEAQQEPAPNAYGLSSGEKSDPAEEDIPLDQLPIDPLFTPPDTPDGYRLESNPAVPATVEEVRAIRQWFHTLRLPQPIAQSLYSEVERMAPGLSKSPPSPAEIDRMNIHTMAQLRNAWGDRTETMLGYAKQLINQAARTHPLLKTTLARGPGSNAVVVRQLAEHAARLYGGAGKTRP